jgi:hypothetical protein
MKHRKRVLIHLTGKKKCLFLILKNCGIMKHFFLMFFLYKLSAEFQPFFKTKGVKSASEAEDRG